ncbi:hypothetical protein [Beijerinckia mobilis]|uniref:hypothetical protein n=1 Tax=Beijerinckia mobilis TaxID=231434 RepID=UPI0012EC37B3|nr:hypothetical protein [Beijerinckia mobilis]
MLEGFFDCADFSLDLLALFGIEAVAEFGAEFGELLSERHRKTSCLSENRGQRHDRSQAGSGIAQRPPAAANGGTDFFKRKNEKARAAPSLRLKKLEGPFVLEAACDGLYPWTY